MTDFPSLSTAERDLRWAKTLAFLADHDLECLVTFGNKGRERYDAYLSNEHLEGATIFPAQGAPIFVTWHYKMISRSLATNLDPDMFWIKDKRIGPYGPTIVAALEKLGLAQGNIGVVGLEAKEAGQVEGIVSYNTWKHILDGLPQATFRDVTTGYGRVMMVRSAEALACVRRSAEIGEMACQAMLDTARVGVLEHEVAAVILDTIHRGGARAADPFLILALGADDIGWFEPPWEQAGGRPREIRDGDLLSAELFPAYAGQETQQQMTIVFGEHDPVLDELDVIAQQCFQAGLEQCRPGKSFYDDVCPAMIQPMLDNGCWQQTPMIHSLGPLMWVSPMGFNREQYSAFANYPGAMDPIRHDGSDEDLILQPGMVFAFEPNACKGSRRVNLGAAVVVTEGEAEVLNELPNRLNRVD